MEHDQLLKTIPKLLQSFCVLNTNDINYDHRTRGNGSPVRIFVEECRKFMEKQSGRKLPDFSACMCASMFKRPDSTPRTNAETQDFRSQLQRPGLQIEREEIPS